MFLHSGASLHGHEFSPVHSPTARRSPLARSAFSTPSSGASYYDNSTTIRPARRPSTGPRRNSEHILSHGPELKTMSEDGCSCAEEGSETTAGGTGKRRGGATRSRTLYQIAHPAPTLTRQQKLLHIRPKLLLQLQRLSSDRRPVPTIDVLPSTVVVPRLMKRFPRMFKGKGELGANDVIIVKSEDYDAPDDEDIIETADDESLANREVVAVICQLRGLPGGSEICLGDGSIWYGTPMPKGVFEFVTTEPVTGEKTTARWVQRVRPRLTSSTQSAPLAGSSVPNDYKYLFSILHPNSRRHPILASITQNSLDIPDNYTTVSSSASRYPRTSPMRSPTFDWQPDPVEDDNLERTTIAVDDNMRRLIQVTGVWIALRQGWCPYFKYDDVAIGTLARTTSASLSAPGNRACSTSHAHDLSRGAAGDTRASTPESNHGSFGAVGGKILRSSTQMFRSSPSSTSHSSFDPAGPPPRRAVSTGTAFMQRAAARRTGHPPSTVASDSEGELVPSSPGRASTTDATISLADHRSTPSPLALFGSSTTSESPNRQFRRRVQSFFVSSSPLQKSHPDETYRQTNGYPPSHVNGAVPLSNVIQQSGEKRGGRWNSLIRLFRCGDNSTR